MGRLWFPAAEMDHVLWTDEGGDGVIAPSVLSQQAMAPHCEQSPAAPRAPSASLSQAIASWQRETSNGWPTSAHKSDVMVEIGSL